jgi:hypothetical protein
VAHSVKKPWSTPKLRRFKTPEGLQAFVDGTTADIDEEALVELSARMQLSRTTSTQRRSTA